MPTRADYAKINIACKELGLDRHQLIADRYGLSSSKQLTFSQLQDLYAHFRSLGWRIKHKKGDRYEKRFQRKVQALWITLAKAGVIRNGSDQAMNRYIARLTKKDHLKWCNEMDCYPVIESLKDMAARNGVDLDR